MLLLDHAVAVKAVNNGFIVEDFLGQIHVFTNIEDVIKLVTAIMENEAKETV